MLFAFKAYLEPDQFVEGLRQLAIASIISNITTFRFEILLFQLVGRLEAVVLLVPLVIAILSTAIANIVLNWIGSLVGVDLSFSAWGAALALGLGLVEMQTFLCIQIASWRSLVLTRVLQGLGMLAVGGFAAIGKFSTAEDFVRFYGLSILLPFALWLSVTVWRKRFNFVWPQNFFNTFVRMSLRGISLSSTQLVAALYVNIAALAAVSMMSTQVAADFVFLMRFVTAPVTLLRQVFGQILLSEFLAAERRNELSRALLIKLMWKRSSRSLVLYFIFAALSTMFVFALQEAAKINNPNIVFPLFVAGVFQLISSQIGLVRIIIREEVLFFFAELVRVFIMVCILYLVQSVAFPIRYGIGSAVIYFLYILLVLRRVQRIFP